MSLIDLFFPKDYTGRRKISILTVAVILCVLSLPHYFLKKRSIKSSHSLTPEEQIIKKEDMIEMKNPKSDEKKKTFIDEIPLLLSQEKSKETPQATQVKKLDSVRVDGEKPRRPANTPMIVFDTTDNARSDKIVPLGSMVKCVLVHNIVTNNFVSPVIVQVWDDFYFHDLLLPFGSRIYGTARAGKERDRVLVSFHTIVFQNGKEIKIKAIGLSQDGSAGLTGIVIDQHNKKRVVSMLVNFLSGLTLGLQQTATNAVTGIDQVVTNSRNAVLQGAANTFEEEAKRIQKEIENAEGYAIVSAGSNLIVYFEQSTDVNPL